MEIFTGVDAKFVRGGTFGVIRVQYSSDCGVIRITMFFRLGIDNGRNMSHTKLIVSIENYAIRAICFSSLQEMNMSIS